MNAKALARIKRLVSELTHEEKENLVGFLASDGEHNCDGYGIAVPSTSFYILVALADYVRSTRVTK